MASYDYIVVGGGTAGCVLARRLSEDEATQVLLVEAGDARGPARVADPASWRSLLGSEADWSFQTVPQVGLNDARVPYPSGKMLGGSSSTNAMTFLRGHPANFDAWAASDAPGWGYRDMLPFFMRSEQAPSRDPQVRGLNGPMVLTPRSALGASALVMDGLAALADRGYPITEDLNGVVPDGAGWPDRNVVDGRRQSAADAYLGPVLHRPNLTVATDAQVRRLIIDDGRCRGIEYMVGTQPRQDTARAEVVLTAGAIGSPQLLMVSGIGPRAHLQNFGIDVIVDAPQVGRNLQDHPMTSVVFAPTEKALPAVRGAIHSSFIALLRTSPSAVQPDMQLLFVDAPYFSSTLNGPSDAYTIACSLMTPASRGSIRLASPDITTPPLIDPNYLGDKRDIERLVAGIRMARGIGNHESLRAWNDGEIFPGPNRQDDASLTEYLRRSIIPYFHSSGTCRMGVDREAVVDPALRVQGIEGLRIADASIMPSIVSANTNATVMAIAERAAALIKPTHHD